MGLGGCDLGGGDAAWLLSHGKYRLCQNSTGMLSSSSSCARAPTLEPHSGVSAALGGLQEPSAFCKGRRQSLGTRGRVWCDVRRVWP